MDLDVLKEIPGYKAILKSVIRSQIQLLIEQLSEHAGEEAVILTASLHDGTLSHLGSNTGKGFLEGRDEIKSQFLGYCLKSHHKKKTSEVRSSPYQRPSVQPASHRRARSQNVSTLQEGSNLDLFTPPEIHRAPSHPNGQNDTRVNIKLESSEQGTSRNQGSGYVADSATFPSSLQLSHTQTSSEHDSDDKNELQNNSNPENDNENDENTATSIKIEPITENEMELEITGVEPGKLSGDPESWGQGHSISANSDTAGGSDGDQSTYKSEFPWHRLCSFVESKADGGTRSAANYEKKFPDHVKCENYQKQVKEEQSDLLKAASDRHLQSKKFRLTGLPLLCQRDRDCTGSIQELLQSDVRNVTDDMNLEEFQLSVCVKQGPSDCLDESSGIFAQKGLERIVTFLPGHMTQSRQLRYDLCDKEADDGIEEGIDPNAKKDLNRSWHRTVVVRGPKGEPQCKKRKHHTVTHGNLDRCKKRKDRKSKHKARENSLDNMKHSRTGSRGSNSDELSKQRSTELGSREQHLVKLSEGRSFSNLGWKYKCPYCKQLFTTELSLKVHTYRHNSELPHKCEVCFKGFLKQKHLMRHKTDCRC